MNLLEDEKAVAPLLECMKTNRRKRMGERERVGMGTEKRPRR